MWNVCTIQNSLGKDVPRWQKLTKEDFVDTILSDTDDEVDEVEQTVAVSGFHSQSIPDEKFYYIVCQLLYVISTLLESLFFHFYKIYFYKLLG